MRIVWNWRLGALAVVLCAALTACGLLPSWNKPQPGAWQGWTDAQQDWWSNINQGSRLAPWPWMQALEQPGPGTGKFMAADYLANFRILPPRDGAPAGALPVGFALDSSPDDALIKTKLRWYDGQDSKQQWVGLTCATCHTAELDYQGKSVRVFGGPSLFDYQSFVETFDKALEQTRDSAAPGADPARWNRFATGVLAGHGDTPANRAALLSSLNQLITWEQQTEALNATPLRYGYGRVDAVGHIFNRVLLFGGAQQPTPNNAADAPVSYPFLWDITKEYQVQWDGIAKNNKLPNTPFDYGAMGRNTGEVLGVFGETVIKPRTGPNDYSGYASSVEIENLNKIETLLTILKPAPWRGDLFGQPGAIDVAGPNGQKLTPDEVVGAGKDLFGHMCAGCHGGTPNANGGIERMLTFQQLGDNLTDIWMACNAWGYKGASGQLANTPVNYINGATLKPIDNVSSLLTTSAIGTMLNQKQQLATAALQSIFGTALPRGAPPTPHGPQTPEQVKQQRRAACMAASSDPLMAYKARPLDGIWATGPFLHNGSVPTLYDLLKAPADRPKSFQVGTRQFDPKKVGYVTDASAPGNSFTYDTSKDGNSNGGHDYGVEKLTETQRLELLEYLKTL